MKKSIVSILSFCLVISTLLIPVPVHARSAEILRNPGFEEDVDYWQSAVNTTLIAVGSYGGVTPQSGSYYIYSDNRYGNADGPMQRIEDQLNFYGPGTYNVKAHMRLPSDSIASNLKVWIVIRTVSTDKTSGSEQYPGINWFTSPDITINNTSWTAVEGTIAINWSEKIEVAEFYFMSNSTDPAMDLCIDTTSMTRIDYEGDTFVFISPTHAPTATISPILSLTPSVTDTPSSLTESGSDVLQSSDGSSIADTESRNGYQSKTVIIVIIGIIMLAATALLILNLKARNSL